MVGRYEELKGVSVIRAVLIRLAALWIAIVMFGISLGAQTRKGSFEIGGYTGSTFSYKIPAPSACDATGCTIKEPATSHTIIGVHAGASVASWFSLLGDLTHIPFGSTTATRSGVSSTIGGSTTTIHGVAEFQPKLKIFIPFGSIGLGVSNGSLNLDGGTFDNPYDYISKKLSAQAGAGFRLYFSRSVGLKVGIYEVGVNTGGGYLFAENSRYFVVKTGIVFTSKRAS
jgi:hypothetical protein